MHRSTGGRRAWRGVAALAASVAVTAGLLAAAGTVVTPGPARAPSPRQQLPPAGVRFDYQLGGAVGGGAAAWRAGVPEPAVVARDSEAPAWAGKYNICYLNAFQSQPGDSSLAAFYLKAPVGATPRSGVVARGGYQYDVAWGEYLLDVKGGRGPLVTHFESVMTDCAQKGFRAVEFDNLDTYTRAQGGISEGDALAYAGDLIAAAHRNGLAAAQKNAAEIAGRAPFDFVVSEECLIWSECGRYTSAFRIAFDIEYSDDLTESAFQSRCSAETARGTAPTFVFRDRDLTTGGVRRWCTAQPAGQVG